MSVHTNTARRCFVENCETIDVREQPYEWNLCNGLNCLALAIEEIELEVEQLKRQFDQSKDKAGG